MWDRIDVLVVPTAPTHYTIEQMQADPVTLNRNLGAYTNFVNLLDYAALSVPSSLRPRRPAVRHHLRRPLRQRLAAGRPGPALPPRHRAAQGATGQPLPEPHPSRPAPRRRRCRSPWSARTCPACR
jgi:allophanate hydrolase